MGQTGLEGRKAEVLVEIWAEREGVIWVGCDRETLYTCTKLSRKE